MTDDKLPVGFFYGEPGWMTVSQVQDGWLHLSACARIGGAESASCAIIGSASTLLLM